MIIFCNNLSCKHNKRLDKTLFFFENENNRRNNTPYEWEDKGLCLGKCLKDFCGFEDINIVEGSLKHNIATCSFGTKDKCEKKCIWNNNGVCTREELFVDNKIINGKNHWVCKLQSQVGISGRMDFSRFGQKKDMF